ncbi:MAG: hypothetical protein U0K68_07780 [Agathobacter sp.]|nr:hypothetical protein [Agathobacter sp.]
MKYSPNQMLEHIKEKELVFDFINSLACHVKNYTIAEITDSKFEKEEEGYFYKSKNYGIDIPVTDDEILTAVINGIYVSVFLSRHDNDYRVHFLVHKYPKSMKSRFEEEIAREVIEYMIVEAVIELNIDTLGKLRSYLEG